MRKSLTGWVVLTADHPGPLLNLIDEEDVFVNCRPRTQSCIVGPVVYPRGRLSPCRVCHMPESMPCVSLLRMSVRW